MPKPNDYFIIPPRCLRQRLAEDGIGCSRDTFRITRIVALTECDRKTEGSAARSRMRSSFDRAIRAHDGRAIGANEKVVLESKSWPRVCVIVERVTRLSGVQEPPRAIGALVSPDPFAGRASRRKACRAPPARSGTDCRPCETSAIGHLNN